ncbi:DUF4019 domain-containing protein [Aurantiacibacter hainanensis]|uniref:DUF4019 domain-containing protein n=1 Tax=Aurantiacibacter hainanensis TaxID=3076114 RepID=UPI0030C6AEF6
MSHGYDALTEKEKDTLRLILGGHDAKSMARELELSVHTVNERLRSARRKLSVTSSKEAARLLLEEEEGSATPEFLGHKQLGEAARGSGAARMPSAKAGIAPAWIVAGAIFMSLVLALLALSPTMPVPQAGPDDARTASVAATDAEAEDAARDWLALTDASDWQASYEATGTAFRRLNSQQVWEDASIQARVPLGTVTSREAIAFQNLPAPPAGYTVVRFRTDFAERAGVTETVTLEREGGSLRVVAYLID